jgi:hypothetical protein
LASLRIPAKGLRVIRFCCGDDSRLTHPSRPSVELEHGHRARAMLTFGRHRIPQNAAGPLRSIPGLVVATLRVGRYPTALALSESGQVTANVEPRPIYRRRSSSDYLIYIQSAMPGFQSLLVPVRRRLAADRGPGT